MTDPTSPYDPPRPEDHGGGASPYRPDDPQPFAAPGTGPVDETQPYAVPDRRPGDDAGPYELPTPPPPGYGAPSYGQGYGAPTYGQGHAVPYGAPAVPQERLAGWGARVGAYLLDSLLLLPGQVLTLVGFGMFVLNAPVDAEVYRDVNGEVISSTTANEGDPRMMGIAALIMLLSVLLTLALWVWNRVVRQGRGKSWGKKVLGLSLVDGTTGAPVGAGKSLLREIAHYLDGLVANIGYLWPLWDARRQTFADKICDTLVVKD